MSSRTPTAPVVIVGAGLAGLSAAVFLGVHGIRALVLERHATTSRQPKARGQNQHTMEALRVAGIAEDFVAASPRSDGFLIRIAESASGPVFHEIVHDTRLPLEHLTPAVAADASQAEAERILAGRARELGAEIRFGTRVDALAQDDDGVDLRVTDLNTGAAHRQTTQRVRAEYVVAADGHRSPLRSAVGINTHGRGRFADNVVWLIRADLTGVHNERQTLHYVRNSALSGGNGAVVSTDRSDEFVVVVEYDPETTALSEFDGERGLEQLRIATGVSDLRPEILERTTTEIGMRVADRFSAGRVHLVGDAAHTMPPQGGMGGNTAIMDGFYLAWKLAAVLRSQAGPGLLDSHDAERRPVGELLADNQYKNAIVRTAPHRMDELDSPPIENPLLLFFGYRHRAAVVTEAEDSGELLEDPMSPTGRPGSRAPHVVLRRGTDEMSTINLYGRRFVLLTGSAAWSRAAERVATELGVPIKVALLDDPGLPLENAEQAGAWRGAWTQPHGVPPHGAVLVRPDRFIAWRSTEAADAGALSEALRTILAR